MSSSEPVPNGSEGGIVYSDQMFTGIAALFILSFIVILLCVNGVKNRQRERERVKDIALYSDDSENNVMLNDGV